MKSRYRLSIGPGRAKEALSRTDAIGQALDVLGIVVDVEAGPRRRRQVVTLHEGLRAVVAGPNRDPLLIQDGRDVVWMDAIDDEADDAGMLVGAARPEG